MKRIVATPDHSLAQVWRFSKKLVASIRERGDRSPSGTYRLNTHGTSAIRLHPEDLRERRASDLQLALGGLPRREHALHLVAGSVEGAGDGGAGVAVAPREDLDCEPGEARATAPARRPRAASARRSSAVPARFDAMRGAMRCEPQRSCSLAASTASAPALVRGDRLVLDAVVRRESPPRSATSAGAARSHRGGLATRAAPAAAHHRSGDGRGEHHAEDPDVLERQLRLRQGALDGGITTNASPVARLRARPGRRRSARARLAPRRVRIDPSACAHRGGPVPRPVDEQAVAQGHPAQTELCPGGVVIRAGPP